MSATAGRAFAVYVSNADSGEISVLRLDAQSGALTLAQRQPVDGIVMPMALSPDQRFLYAARRSAPFAALSFGIDAATGQLSALGEAPLPQSMAYIATDRSGRFLFSASYGAHQIAVNAIDADGRVGAVLQVLDTPPNAHAIQADPANRFVYATSLGGGVLLQFAFDAATGTLTPLPKPTFAPHTNASPRHFVFSPDARFIYLLNELDASVDVLEAQRDGQLRTLQTLPTLAPGFTGEPWAADIRLTSDGRFLYTSERRASTLAAFAVDAANGRLTPLAHTPTEAQPRGFHITPDGRFLIAAGQLSNRVSAYRIDADSGALSACSSCEVGRNPNWIETLALPA